MADIVKAQEEAREKLNEVQELIPETITIVSDWVKANSGAGYRNLAKMLAERT